ncbi:L,D-transpeptidase/peptidoglycan binding protein [Clostridium sp. SYSU_GA19001]|uniref:L,D-transpeptidase family protein n=1 Tax=Clostridium caldaquaticum TaxID=2940653 RepID=UPI002076E909|nr:L,D-transpeptidase family protein [Clostridium caldaquaticum]MCM8712050.1 L,D-transpeptidase/peptidoglycan binding protein [Clostridium caldaquaticum]
MKSINIKKLFKSEAAGNIIIFTASLLLIYLLISLYFARHFFFCTVINGVDVSLKAHDTAEDKIISYIKDYKLQLIERDGEVEEIFGQDIELKYNEKNSIYRIYYKKNLIKWIISLFNNEKYYVDDLYIYNKNNLENKINELKCLNKEIIYPQDVSFKYSNGSYEMVKEVYGNKVNKDKLKTAIETSILKGETKLDLNENLCYENPKYTLSSNKTLETKDLLNKYVRANITYIFGREKEVLDGNTINEWLSVDKNLDVVISEIEIMKYVRELSRKYDTVGIVRNFKTSVGKIVEVKGGLYGWKINHSAETKALMENIKKGEVLEKEPVYAQKALTRDEDEIGSTYVEINITRQYLWFYKEGKLIAQGAVVTGNPNRGYSTVLGTFMLNYKQKEATLKGPGYEASVTYWMPFYGNIGIHDAPWRYSFGGEIYKRNGSHGCVNAPLYLAKSIFENIHEGTPIICYEE